MVALLLGLGVAAWAGIGPGRRGQVGEALQLVSDRAREASTSVQGKLAEARTSARNDALEQQVAARLHGEKTLGAEKIEVTVLDEGTATLKGQVPDALAKDKAVALTRDTRGVLRVEDHLAIPPAPRYFAAPAAAAPQSAVAARSRVVR
jgi:osmotically-inducible protein OsmY